MPIGGNLEKIRLYLQWWAEYKLPQSVPREFEFHLLQEIKLIPVLVGPRRSGKSTLFMQIISLLSKNIPRQNIIYVNFEDDRLLPLDGSELSQFLSIHKQSYPSGSSHPLYLFLDEIQNLPNWEKIVRRIYETEPNVRLYITGSNSSLFSANIATSLRGRSITFKVHPLNFKEFLKFNKVIFEEKVIDNLRYSGKKDRVLYFFDKFLQYGGFPEVVLAQNELIKEKILKEYLHTIFFADIIERYEIRNVKLMDALIKIITRQMSSLFSANKLTNTLNSIGYKTSKNTILSYLQYLEEALFGKSIPIFSYSVKDRLQHPKKFYLVDNGVYLASNFIKNEDWGKLLENLVFNTLAHIHENIFYWKDVSGYEVDFVLPHLFDNKDVHSIIQVCYNPEDEKTMKREIRSLQRASKEFNVQNALLITRDTWDVIKEDNLTVEILPYIQWALTVK